MATKKKAVAKKAASRKTAKPKKVAVKKAAARKKPAAKKKTAVRAAADVPSLFRLNIEVADLDAAEVFYGRLLGIAGRRQAGARVYFDCGPVTLQVVDVGNAPHPAAKALYFTVRDLDAVFVRAQALDALSTERVHGADGGAISVRPWGERSFYAEDLWGNPLCFVEAGTTYPG